LIAAQQFAITFRITQTMTAIELLVLFWLLSRALPSPTAVAAALAALSLPLAFISTYMVASTAAAEHALYARALTGLQPGQFHAIVVLRPEGRRKSFGLTLRKDFGGLGPSGNIGYLFMRRTPQGETTFDITEFVLPAVTGVPTAIEDNAVIIDTSQFFGEPNFKDFSGRVGTVSGRPRGTIGPMYAIDHNPNTFWETCGQPLPYELEVDLPTARTLAGYSMSTIEEPQRMPNNWDILVSSDKQEWRQVHQMTQAGGWQLLEKRQYQIAPVSDVRAIKLRVNNTDAGPCLRVYEFTPEFAN
jgi:hypothetical protein